MYYKGCGKSITSAKEFIGINPVENLGYKVINSGVNTYRLDFAKKDIKSSIVLGGDYNEGSALVISSGSYSPGFEFRVRDYCKDNFSLIFTQALISKLSNNNMDVIYVVSLEEKGEDRNKWFGCYAITDNFSKGKWAILNGKHKLEDYKITDSTYAKAYIWNKGKGDLAISYLELMFENPVNISGEKTLITQLKNQEIKSESGYQPYKEKTKINVDRIKTFKPNNNFTQIHFRDGSVLFTSKGTIKSFQLKSEQLISEIKSVKNGKAENLASDGVNNFLFPSINSNTISISKSIGSSSVLKDTVIKTNIPGDLIASENNYSALGLFLCISSDGKNILQFEKGLSFKKLFGSLNLPKGYSITNLKAISSNSYLCIAENKGDIKLWLGETSNTGIVFRELTYSSDIQKKLLNIERTSNIFALHDNQFLVFSTEKRNALYRIEISSSNSITIKEAYHLVDVENKISPFYFEKAIMTQGIYNGKVGYLMYCYNDTNTNLNEFINSNHSLYFFEIK
jgi:hypothetical protein